MCKYWFWILDSRFWCHLACWSWFSIFNHVGDHQDFCSHSTYCPLKIMEMSFRFTELRCRLIFNKRNSSVKIHLASYIWFLSVYQVFQYSRLHHIGWPERHKRASILQRNPCRTLPIAWNRHQLKKNTFKDASSFQNFRGNTNVDRVSFVRWLVGWWTFFRVHSGSKSTKDPTSARK